MNDKVPHLLKTANRLLFWCAALYGAYSLFLLIEVLDFLSMLHSKPPDYHPTYDLVNVTYYIVEMIVCLAMVFSYLALSVVPKSWKPVVYTCVAITLFRIVMVYYLYFFTTPEYRWVPYIYKKANELSPLVRTMFLPTQIILGAVSAWFWWKNGQKMQPSD
ncbi:MAG: hypothetical protein MUD08_11930 [Cytophagales bacterium]|jgi:hypothetical protein|nr:hypothetical protein [Cytophagales bacterium]